jgi:ABC-type bacteriocin/lantibiotic exporter with double-glycine peptidase domain
MIIKNFPELRQAYEYDCGATALQSVLIYYGFDVCEGKIIKMAKTNKEGTQPEEILKVLKKFKLKAKLISPLSLEDLKKFLNNGWPVIILLQAWANKAKDYSKDWSDGHYVIAIGYDNKKIYFEDPASIRRTYLSYKELLERWHDCRQLNKKYYNLGIVIQEKRKIKIKPEHMD